MNTDLAMGWRSPVSVGEFVLISYGMPDDESIFNVYGDSANTDPAEGTYWYNVKIDLDNDDRTYNSTLWQKVYSEDAGHTVNGLDYKLLASMTGNTPLVNVELNTLVADDNVQVTYDHSVIDNPIIIFKFPEHYKWYFDRSRTQHDNEPEGSYETYSGVDDSSFSINTVDPGQGAKAAVHITTSKDEDDNYRTESGLTTGNTNKYLKDELTLELDIPQAWDFSADKEDIEPTKSPDVDITEVDTNENTYEDTKHLHFKLPRAQLFEFHEGDPLDIGATPVITEWDHHTASSEDNPNGVLDTRNFTYQLPLPYRIRLDRIPIDAGNDPAFTDMGSGEYDPEYGELVVEDRDDGVKNLHVWHIEMPKAWRLKMDTDSLPAGDAPYIGKASGVEDLDGDISKHIDHSDEDAEPNGRLLDDTKTWTLWLPKTWRFTYGITDINANDQPSVELSVVEDRENGVLTDRHQHLQFHVPKAWNLDLDPLQLQSSNLNPTLVPHDVYDENNLFIGKTWTLTLPKAWQFDVGFERCPAYTSPSWQEDDIQDGNDFVGKQWTLTLPRAWTMKLERVLQNAELAPRVQDVAGVDSDY